MAAVMAGSVPEAAGVAGWTWPPYIVLPLITFALLYGIGQLKMARHGSPARIRPTLCFALGWASLLLALDSPIHEISEQLFWVHMTQHEILVLVSAPLLILSRPLVPLLWALPAGLRDVFARWSRSRVFKRAWIFVSAPFMAWLLHAAALWTWHAPALFVATLHSDPVHAAQHISFLGTALLFWWALLDSHGGRLGYGAAIVYVFTTAIHTSVLGALLTFAPRVWYSPYLATAPAWNISALQDQQIGGLIMWVPAGGLLTVVGLLFFIQWLHESQRRWEYTRTAELMRTAGGGA